MKTKFLFATALLAVSCASAPSTSSPETPAVTRTAPAVVPEAPKPGPSAPDWARKTVYVDGVSLVFVVGGVETADVAALARDTMEAYLDIAPRPGLTVANRAVEEYLDKLCVTAPVEKYLKAGQGWWKIVVPKSDWDVKRRELLALYEAASADPSLDRERAADELLKQGRYVDAISAYVDAAEAAAGPTASARFRSVVEKAQDVLSQFTLTSTSASQTTRVGVPFGSDIEVKLAYGSSPLAPAVSGATLRVSYKAKVNGRVAISGTSVQTNAEGVARFPLPTPDFAVRDSVVVLVDVNPWMEALADAPKDGRELVAGFETVTAARKLQIPYAVESAAKSVPLVVALADFDEKGAVRARQETTSSLIAALQKAGFTTSGLPVNPTLLKSPNENVILAAWKFQGKKTGRAVYGTVSLVSVTASGSQFSAEVAGTLKVVDLETNALVYQIKSSKVVTAVDKATAGTLAFRGWAADAVEALASELP